MHNLLALQIRRPLNHEVSEIEALVQDIVDTLYGGLGNREAIPTGDINWLQGWVVSSDTKILAALLTKDDWLDDLWIAEKARRLGLGKALLTLAEKEIRERGYRVGHLRVVSSNENAIAFYKTFSWEATRHFPHEIYGFQMTEMAKPLCRLNPF